MILRTFKPGIGFEARIPWGRLGPYALRVCLASRLIIAIHMWIALRWPNFALAPGAGIGATFVGLIATNTPLRSTHPWSLRAAAFDGFIAGEGTLFPAALGLLRGVAVGALGAWNMTRQSMF